MYRLGESGTYPPPFFSPFLKRALFFFPLPRIEFPLLVQGSPLLCIYDLRLLLSSRPGPFSPLAFKWFLHGLHFHVCGFKSPRGHPSHNRTLMLYFFQEGFSPYFTINLYARITRWRVTCDLSPSSTNPETRCYPLQASLLARCCLVALVIERDLPLL